MAILQYGNQLKYTGSGPLDAKMAPVQNYADLPNIPAQRYPGMTVTVLNGTGGKPEEYWFVGKDKFNGTWVRKIDGLSLNLNNEGLLTLVYNGESIPNSSADLKTYIEAEVKKWADDNFIEEGNVSVVDDTAVLTLSYKDTEMAPLEISLAPLSGIYATKEYVDAEIGKIISSPDMPGAQGDKGVQGDAGDKGAHGDAGDKGVQGDAGDKGVQGDAGDKGAQGDAGVIGTQGFLGIQGFMGIQGLMGIQGAKGTQADQGAQGEQGVQGEKGEPGDGLTYIDEDE